MTWRVTLIMQIRPFDITLFRTVMMQRACRPQITLQQKISLLVNQVQHEILVAQFFFQCNVLAAETMLLQYCTSRG